MKEKILKPRAITILKYYIPIMILLLIVCYFAFSDFMKYFSFDESKISEYLARDLLIVGIWLIFFIVFLLLLLKRNYYEFNKQELIHHRFTNDVSYLFDNIIYIDKEYSLKHKTLFFITKDNKKFYLAMDKDNKLLEVFLKNCKNLKENYINDEFKRK